MNNRVNSVLIKFPQKEVPLLICCVYCLIEHMERKGREFLTLAIQSFLLPAFLIVAPPEAIITQPESSDEMA